MQRPCRPLFRYLTLPQLPALSNVILIISVMALTLLRWHHPRTNCFLPAEERFPDSKKPRFRETNRYNGQSHRVRLKPAAGSGQKPDPAGRPDDRFRVPMLGLLGTARSFEKPQERAFAHPSAPGRRRLRDARPASSDHAVRNGRPARIFILIPGSMN